MEEGTRSKRVVETKAFQFQLGIAKLMEPESVLKLVGTDKRGSSRQKHLNQHQNPVLKNNAYPAACKELRRRPRLSMVGFVWLVSVPAGQCETDPDRSYLCSFMDWAVEIWRVGPIT